MLIGDIMTRKVVAIGPEMPIGDVMKLMEQRNIRHFPICESVETAGTIGNRLVGIVSDRDIRTVGSEHPHAKPGVTLRSPVAEIMITDVLTAHPLDPVEEAAEVLRRNRIGAMPVLDNGQLVGIVTGVDFLDALIAMTGVQGASSRLVVALPERPQALAELLGQIAVDKVGVTSVMMARREGDAVNYVLRVATIDAGGLADRLARKGFEVLWPVPSHLR